MKQQCYFVCAALVTSIAFFAKAYAQELQHTNKSVWPQNGFITLGDKIVLGSAFVSDKERDVITCWHVLDTARKKHGSTNLFYRSGTNIVALTIKRELPTKDIVVFSTSRKLEGEFYPLANFDKIQVGDPLFFIGYDSRLSTSRIAMLFQTATVYSKGPYSFGNIKNDSIMFVADAVKGYSGCAIYTTNREIVALMSLGYRTNETIVINGKKERLNAAWSINPLLK